MSVRATGRRVVAGVLVACLLGALSPAARAEGAHERRAVILLRVLAYDRALARRVHQAVTVVIVYRADDRASQSHAAAATAALAGYSHRVTVAGRPVRVRGLAYRRDGFAEELQRLEADAVYVAPGLDGELTAIAGVTRRSSALTFSGHASYVGRGIAVGLIRDAERIRIRIDLGTARAAGADLSAALLSVAETFGNDSAEEP